jgi:outer membrane protein OmpA-like peptidoglycan-associated protein
VGVRFILLSSGALFSLLFSNSYSQNLVDNGGFENISECPDQMGKITFAENWDNPNGGTADLFCNCGYKTRVAAGVPENSFGTQEAFEGHCYGGFFCSDQNSSRREYLRYTFKEKLKKNQLYCLSFYYSRADYMKISMPTLGALFTSKKHKVRDYLPLPEEGNSIKVNNDQTKWHKFALPYKSNGKEKYLVIGSFAQESNFSQVHGNSTPEKGRYYHNNYSSYYYIDEVSLVKVDNPADCSCNEEESTDSTTVTVTQEKEPEKEIPKPFQLVNLNFEVNKSVILESSFSELDSLASYMRQNPDLKLMISGHTDNTGNDAQNQKLSMDRAKAVADYLQSKSIPEQRISHNGYGSSKPLSSNNNEKGRGKNRRVEFLFMRQE